MEEAKGIRYNKRALHDIDKIEQYIAQEGFPLTAISYTNRVMEHIRKLKNMPERNALCKYPSFARRNYHCSVFEKTHVIVYKISKHSVDIKRIIHGKRLSY